jgi:hypothetical protein
LWSFVHGYITLELADHFAEFGDPVAQVLLPMGVNFTVGLGDDRERAQSSHEAGARLYDSITRGSEGQAALSETRPTAWSLQVTQAACAMHPSRFRM